MSIKRNQNNIGGERMTEKTKAAMMSRLVEIFDNSISQRDVCLSAIAMCMLDGIPTLEKLTRRGSTHQNQFCEQDDQVHSSEQQS